MNFLEPDGHGHHSILFTDVEGSTAGWESALDQMSTSLALHDRIVRTVIDHNGGYVCSFAGDSFGVVFSRTEDALQAALQIQERLENTRWPDSFAIRVRMSLHCGPVIQRDDLAYGPEIVKAAILCEIGNAGQVLLSEEFADTIHVGDCRPLGTHRLRKISAPQTVYQYGQAEFPPLRNTSKRICTVPAARNSTIGRDEETAELLALLESSRLITLTGPGGVGKTRLACDIGLRTLEHNFDAVHLVDLDSIRHERDIPGAFAHGLELTLPPDSDPIEQVLSFLAGRSTLLVIDNCEHLIEPVAAIVDLILDRAHDLQVMATSREPLGLSGEMVWQVPALGHGIDSAATELFIRSAGNRATEDLRTERARRAIHDICTVLDGLPLAIELAAARTHTMSVAEIGRRLSEFASTLQLGGERPSPRAQTLGDVVAWSYDLLTAHEQAAFRRLASFVGGFAAEDLPPILSQSEADARALIDTLVARSLIETTTTERGAVRFRMLNTIRAFALDRLQLAGEQRDAARRHFQHFLVVAELPQHPFMPGPKIAIRHEDEYLNIRAAADWAISEGDVVGAARLATGCVIEIDRRGDFVNGIRWSRAAQGQAGEIGFNAMVIEAFLRGLEGNLALESQLADRAVERANGHPYLLLPVAICLSALDAMVTDPSQAKTSLTSALDAADQSDQPLLNRAFVDIHMATLDLLYQRPKAMLERMTFYSGGMVTYARVCAHLMLGETDAALAAIAAARKERSDAWVHLVDLAEVHCLIAGGCLVDAARKLADSARGTTGRRRWEDDDYLVHFAGLHLARGNNERARLLIDNCRSRHGLIVYTALSTKRELTGWSTAFDDADSLGWLRHMYSPESTERIMSRQEAVLDKEIAEAVSFVEVSSGGAPV